MQPVHTPPPYRFALGTQVERVFAEIARAIEVGLYVYQVEVETDPGTLRLVYANPASAAATGVSLDAILGRPISEAFPGLMATDLPATYLEIALGGEARDLGEVHYGDDRVSPQTFSVRAFPLPERSVGVSFTNFTELRVAEQKAIQTLEEMSDAFFTLDTDWRFTYMNTQSEPLLRRPREELVGKKLWDEFPEALGSPFEVEYRRALSDQTPVSFEAAFEPLNVIVEARAYPVTGGLAVYLRDITAERAAHARLQEGQRLEAIGRVTAGVAHDFNNLLTAIHGYAQLGIGKSVSETTTRYFDQIDSAGQKAASLIRQLLAVGRAQDLSPTVNDLNQVVDELATLLRHLATPAIEVRLELAREPVPAFVDRSQLEQVLINLVINARDAIDGSGTITLVTSKDPLVACAERPADRFGWLQVEDDGPGIPPEVLPRIFEAFFTTKPAETGSGLGLATIHGIVTQSNGTIHVDSTVGTGTTFTVAFPAAASPNAE